MAKQDKAVARKVKTALIAAKKLEDAADALNEFLRACNEVEDGGQARGIDDGRVVLIGNIMEYASYLNGRFGAK